jgi:ArsR family transcriptional regulator
MKTVRTSALDHSVRVVKALADPIRLRLLSLLAGHQEICVCHLHDALELPQPTVSRHLAYLRKSGLVAARKEGLWVHYRLARPASDMHRLLLACVGLADPAAFERDRQHLATVKSCA